MKLYGFHNSYIVVCKQLYVASGTYYMIIHGYTVPVHIHRGIFHGDTLSPFIFIVFVDPLLRLLAVGKMRYRLSYQPHKYTAALITYDNNGYVNDASITAGSIQNLKL